MSMCNIKECLRGLCVEKFGYMPDRVASLPQAGGDRKYFRMSMPASSAPSSLLGVEADDKRDARAFVELAGIFASNGVHVPMVYAHSADYSCYIEEDLGDVSLFSMLGSQRAGEFVRSSLAALVKMQVLSESEWLDAVAYPEFSRRQILWDLNYFKYEYLKNSTVTFDEDALEDDFERFAERLLSLPHEFWGFMMRDCQSRNVMVGDKGNITFIDYQGARRGNRLYDVVSFLWQARAALPASLRTMLFNRYLDSCAMTAERRRLCAERLPLFVLLRTLQVLGAYGFLGLVRRKEHFLKSIPPAVDNLRALLGNGMPGGMPELARVLGAIAGCERFSRACAPAAADGLVVTVTSFSYKKGLPEDSSGNGGGFVFDCRALHNPGRYEEYRHLTGMDAPVIGFLDGCADTGRFLEAAYSLTDSSVERYLSRGFTSLCVSFGCTGGRHRSVYCAEHLAAHLAEKYPVTVRLVHREQGVKKTLSGNPKNIPQ